METETKKVMEVVASNVIEPLLPVLVKKFASVLPGGKKARKIKERGTWERRVGGKDRRISSLEQRLRTGLWLEFHRQTGLGKFEPLNLTMTIRDQVCQAAVKEAQRYEFSDRTSGGLLDRATIVDSAIDIAWKDWESQPRDARGAVLIIEGIAHNLVSKYNVRKLDRRQNTRRASATS
jgi:hypothetical protein